MSRLATASGRCTFDRDARNSYILAAHHDTWLSCGYHLIISDPFQMRSHEFRLVSRSDMQVNSRGLGRARVVAVATTTYRQLRQA
jgi:hypothetical protein